jgi:hypothetical protein
MRVRRVTIENFKKFSPPGIALDLHNQALDDISDRFLVLGDNGSGKTTVLQAIAVTLALAARKIPDVGRFWWKGWLPERYFAHDNPRVEVEVEFSDDELAATQEAARRWWDLAGVGGAFVEPGSFHRVTLCLEGGRVSAKEGRAAMLQLQGRRYIADALTRHKSPRLRELFSRLPGVFWYDQYRTVGLSARDEQDGAQDASADEAPGFALGVEKLDRILRSWYRHRLERGGRGGRDFLGELEQRFVEAFPGRRFAGLEPVYSGTAPTPDDDRFVLSDGKRSYALAEMSAGEQAIFPILFEFTRQQIHRSVVLIDEIDLNLHPPLAQLLFGMLPRLGMDNQFLFTTHASVISTLVSPHAIHRLQEGQLCL